MSIYKLPFNISKHELKDLTQRGQMTKDIPLDILHELVNGYNGNCIVLTCRCGKCWYRKITAGAYRVFGYLCTNKHSPCRGRIVCPTDYCDYGKPDDNEDDQTKETDGHRPSEE